ncbi:MAG TPA: AbrB/MazE/SpoVT family DNA-binding domain-containing protein [Candidatus Hydrogenedentes bacterium]|nr:AbrB/MazE/SpoVT family DNA-binding domain-containing protein [Candidatus Hydrogenedentota bacterium]
MRVTARGQVTIPYVLRVKTGILPGSEVELVEEKGRLYLRKASEPGPGKALVEGMAGKGDITRSTDEILALTRRNR